MGKSSTMSVYAIKEAILQWFMDHTTPRVITPNIISWGRFVLSLVNLAIVIVCYPQPLGAWQDIFVTNFTISVISDFLDGPLARVRHLESEVGAQLDPFADKLTILPAIWVFLHDTDPWLVGIVIGGDVLATVLRWWGAQGGHDIRANIFGKWKMVGQTAGVFTVVYVSPMVGSHILWISLGLGLAGIIQSVLTVKKGAAT